MAKNVRRDTVDTGVGAILAIDVDRLDEEWVEQPTLFFRYAAKAADAKLMLNEAEAELDVVDAELASLIREKFERFGFNKPPAVETVKATVLLQDEHQEAQKVVNKARHDLDVFQAAVSALDHRKRALENLVFLHGQNYFSSPRANKSSREEVENMEIRQRGRHAKKRTREDNDE